MKNNELIREEFSKRLKEALTINNKNGWGEGAYLAKITNVTPKASNKWLNAESIPNREKIIQLAKMLNVNSLWLEYGEGSIQSVEDNKTQKQDYIKIIGDISPWDDNTPLDDDEVEVPFFKEVELAAGNGKTEVIELTDRKLRFSKRTLRDAGVNAKDVACAKISGNSMERLIIDGATIGIDTSEKNIIDGEIYAFDHDGMLRVKYLYRMPGGAVRLRSENAEEHGDEIIPFEKLDKLRILGWVFWWSVVRRKRK